jgi:hypothetical protein
MLHTLQIDQRTHTYTRTHTHTHTHTELMVPKRESVSLYRNMTFEYNYVKPVAAQFCLHSYANAYQNKIFTREAWQLAVQGIHHVLDMEYNYSHETQFRYIMLIECIGL